MQVLKRQMLLALAPFALTATASASLVTNNLVVQLEADSGVVEPATAGDSFVWNDLSVADGSNPAATSLVDRMPSLVMDASPAGDRPVVSFDGADFLNIGANSVFSTNTLSWMAVVRSNIPSQTQWVLGSSYTSLDGGATNPDNFGTNHAWGAFVESGRYRNFARTTTGGIKNPFPSGHSATSDWFIVTGIWNGDLMKTAVMDASGSLTEAVVSGANGVPADHLLTRLGADPLGGNSGLNGDVAALLIYDSNLSAADEQETREYLYQKWFSPVPEPGTLALLAFGLAAVVRRSR